MINEKRELAKREIERNFIFSKINEILIEFEKSIDQ